jgi:hypothetical protein
MAASVAARLAEDEAVAKAAEREGYPAGSEPVNGWFVTPASGHAATGYGVPPGINVTRPITLAEGRHAARNDPARILRRAKAVRDLIAVILAERHDYNDGDPWFSCSQATVPGDDGEPGSGCANDERAGKPCDCGRDARVARLLGIIASEWEDAGHDPH